MRPRIKFNKLRRHNRKNAFYKKWIAFQNNALSNYHPSLPLPELTIYDTLKKLTPTDSWYHHYIYSFEHSKTPFIECNPSCLEQKDEIIFSRKHIILPTLQQRKILFNWFEAYRVMYNETVNLIYKHKFLSTLSYKYESDSPPPHGWYYTGDYWTDNWQELRDLPLKSVKQYLMKKFIMRIPTNKKNKMKIINVPGHILCSAIQKACANFNSAIANYNQGNEVSAGSLFLLNDILPTFAFYFACVLN
jgi:hypothetical protein